MQGGSKEKALRTANTRSCGEIAEHCGPQSPPPPLPLLGSRLLYELVSHEMWGGDGGGVEGVAQVVGAGYRANYSANQLPRQRTTEETTKPANYLASELPG